MNRALFYAWPMAAMLASCAANPDQTIYVMPAAGSAQAGPRAAPGGLAVLVRPVMLPDYLDTTDLLTRSGAYKIDVSRTGRWGERLSKGVTRSLAADLGQRLQAAVVMEGPIQPPAVQIEVAVNAFDVTTAASALSASWTISWQGDARQPLTRHGTFAVPVGSPGGDLQVVAAMAEAVSALADAIAATARPDAAITSSRPGHSSSVWLPVR